MGLLRKISTVYLDVHTYPICLTEKLRLSEWCVKITYTEPHHFKNKRIFIQYRYSTVTCSLLSGVFLTTDMSLRLRARPRRGNARRFSSFGADVSGWLQGVSDWLQDGKQLCSLPRKPSGPLWAWQRRENCPVRSHAARSLPLHWAIPLRPVFWLQFQQTARTPRPYNTIRKPGNGCGLG